MVWFPGTFGDGLVGATISITIVKGCPLTSHGVQSKTRTQRNNYIFSFVLFRRIVPHIREWAMNARRYSENVLGVEKYQGRCGGHGFG
jgi:hypothetical protein